MSTPEDGIDAGLVCQFKDQKGLLAAALTHNTGFVSAPQDIADPRETGGDCHAFVGRLVSFNPM